MKLGSKVCRCRNSQGISVATLAEAIGVSEGGIRQIESGETRSPRAIVCLAIARRLDVPIDWLIDDKQAWPPPPGEDDRIVTTVRRALCEGGLIGELSDDERELLAAWRTLNNPTVAARVLGYISGLAEMASAAESTATPAALDAEPVRKTVERIGRIGDGKVPGRRRRSAPRQRPA